MSDHNPYAPPESLSDAVTPVHCTAIRVTRKNTWADRLRKYRILVDGVAAIKISPGQTIVIPVEAGEHSVEARIDWCGSRKIHCTVSAGETVLMECRSRFSLADGFKMMFYAFFLRNDYLSLEVVSTTPTKINLKDADVH